MFHQQLPVHLAENSYEDFNKTELKKQAPIRAFEEKFNLAG